MIRTAGALRRRIQLSSRALPNGGGEARGAVEDDFHHFRVDIRHDGETVTSATAAALRFPYTACPAAGGQLALLVGMPLSAVSNSVTRQTDASIHCTHMLDLAGLAIAVAARGIAARRYDCTIPDRVDGITHPWVERDGVRVMEWIVDKDQIVGPDGYGGHSLRAGFAGWVLKSMSQDDAEAALVLRRATTISVGRSLDVSSWVHARSTGFCYSQQPDRAEQALTMDNSIRDWPSHAPLCAEDQDFLAFAG